MIKLKDNSTKEIDTALYQLEQSLTKKIKDSTPSTDTDATALVEKEATARKAADATLQKNIDNEATEREAADATLSSSIANKQDKLTAGDNITIESNIISAANTTYSVESPVTLNGTTIGLTTVPISKGGTGGTTGQAAFDNIADGVRTSTNPADSETMLLHSTSWYKTTVLSLWEYIKNKISSVLGLTASSYSGKAANADYPTGFSSRKTTQDWGNQNGTLLTAWASNAGGDIAFRDNSGQINVINDGFYYQNEGNYKVVDENSIGSLTAGRANNLVNSYYHSGASTSYTISTFLDKLVSLGVIAKNVEYAKPFRFSWAYAYNGILSTDYGNITLAGTQIIFYGVYCVDPTTSIESGNNFDIIFQCNPHLNDVGQAVTLKYTCRSGSQYGPKWTLYNCSRRTVIPTSMPSTIVNGDIWIE